MATGGPVYRTTKETENYERLCRAFVDLSTDVYRDILRYYMFVEPSELWNEVNGCPDLKNKLPNDEQNKLNYSVHNCTISNLDLSFLYKLIRSISDQNLRLDLDKKIQASNIWIQVQADRALMSKLRAAQEDKVKRASRIGNYSECDCLLLSILLDSQCPCYQIPALVPTSNRWGANPPRPMDVKLGDDIERIRILRNSRYGHVSDTCIPDSDFKTIWTELTEVMSRMDRELQTGGYYSTALAELEKTNLDGRWREYETKIKELNKNVKLVQLELHKQKKDQERTTHQVATLSSEQKDLVEKHEDITQQVATLSCEQKDLIEKQEDITQQVDRLSSEQMDLMKKHEDITLHVATLSCEQKDLMEKHEDITQHVATLSCEQKDLIEKHENITQQVATLNQKQKDAADLEQMIKTQIASHDTNVAELSKVQNLLENIITAKHLWDESRQFFEDIKKEHLIEKAENKLRQMERKEDRWDRSIEYAAKLEKELQDSRSNDTDPFIPDALENELQRIQPSKDFNYLQFLHDAKKSDHEHNIHGLIDKALKEIKLKKEEISPDKLKAWQEDDETFCATKSTELIYKTVKHKGYLICGLPGAGKTVNVHHIALRLKGDGYRLCCVDGIKELIDKTGKFKTTEKQVYVIDDVFGVHGVNDETVKEWTEKHKDDIKRCLDKPNIILLCSSRVQVANDHKLSNIIKSYFTVINISEEEAKLPSEARSKERVEIFRKHASVKGRVDLLKEKVENKIKKIECPAGCFPLICRLYVGDKETNQTIENYFNKPLDQLQEHIQSLQNSPSEDVRLGYFCLLMCMLYNNKVPVNTMEVGKEEQETKHKRQELLELCELSESTSRPTIKKKMDTLLQTFVKREGSHYLFVHDIIHDAVIKHVSGLSSGVHKVIMRHCSSKFILHRVHLSGVVCKDRYGRPGHDTESCINIRRDSFTCWGFRVLDIVRDGVRTSDQLYNDIDEGRCSRYDHRVRYDNPWRDVFYNRCVHSTEGQTAIVQALKSCDIQTIVCTKGYSLPSGGLRVTGLHWAMYEGLTHIVTQTMSMLSPTQLCEVVSIHGGGLLCWAISKECGTDVIQALIVGGADVNTPAVYDVTPLCLAIDKRCGADVIQALIVGGADVNTPAVLGRTPLHESVSRGDYEITQLLVDNGADVNQCHRYGESVLYTSQLYGHDTITELLQSRGAVCIYKGKRYNHVTDIPDLTLFDFVLYNNYQAVKKRIERGDDINQCKYGKSVLYWSQLRGYDTITELLQSRGAVCIYEGKQYNHVTDIPDLTLFDFVSYNNYQAVKILIERGDDVNQCDKYGTSVLYKSQLWGRDTITELLQSRGAVCIYKGKRYTTITDIPGSEVEWKWEREKIRELKEKQNLTK